MSGRRRDRCDNQCWAAAERWIDGRYVCIRCALEAKDQGIDDRDRPERETTTEGG